MNNIRQARAEDIGRIAEIFVFNYRLNFYPMFHNEKFFFEENTVMQHVEHYADKVGELWVYDDGIIKGATHIKDGEIKKLYVEPAFQGNSIGAKLIEFAISQKNAHFLWVLDKNIRAKAFYERHGFKPTNDKEYIFDSDDYLIRMEK